ncbi:MAG: phage tail tape measure protein [Ruminococcus sp.]|nr:phage tail tape measure protein [Ruminococcus sp.]
MANYGYLAKIGADTSSFSKAMKNLVTESKQGAGLIRDALNAIKVDPANITAAETAMRKLTEQQNAAKDSLTKLDAIKDDVYSSKDVKAIEQYESAVLKLQTQVASTAAQMGKLSETLNLKEAASSAERQLGQIENSLEQTGRQGGESLAQGVTDSFASVKGTLDTFVGNVFADLFNNAMSAINAALEVGIRKVYETGTQLETSMSRVAATMLLDRNESTYADLYNAAAEAGKSTVFTASQAADALNYFALAGYKADEAIAALPRGLAYAQASEQDLATAVDVLTDSMTALGLKTEDAKESADNMQILSDQMAAAASDSNTSVAQLGEAVLTIGATARSLKGGTAELNTMLGVLADNGIKGEEGGTKLRNALNSLISPTKDAQAALDKLHVSLYDDNEQKRALPDVFLDLENAMKGFSEKERDQTLADIFNTRDLAAVNALLGTSAERFEELQTVITNSDGACEKMAETLTDTVDGTKKLFDSAVDGFANSVFEQFGGDIKELFGELAEYVGKAEESLDGKLGDKLSELAGKLHDLALKMAEFALDEGLPALIDGLTWVVDHTDEIKSAAETLGKGFLALAGVNGVTKAVDAFNSLKTGVTGLKAAFENAGVAGALGGIATEGAAASTAASSLGAVLSALPWAAVATGAALAASALASWLNAAGEAALAASALKTSADEGYLAITTASAALDDMYNNIEKDRAIDDAAEKAHAYWKQLEGLVDADGKIIEKQGLVQTVIKNLNTTLGTHMEIVDGQIQGYADLAGSIDGVIEAYRRQAIVDYKKEGFDKAVVEEEGINEQLKNAEKNYKNAQSVRATWDKTVEIIEGMGASYSTNDLYLEQLERVQSLDVQYADDFLTYMERVSNGRIDSAEKLAKNAAYKGKSLVLWYDEFLKENEQALYNTYGAALTAKRQNEEIQKDFAALFEESEGYALSENMAHADESEQRAKEHFEKFGYSASESSADEAGDEDAAKTVKEEFDRRKLQLDIDLKDAKISSKEYEEAYKALIDELFGGTDSYNEYYSKWQDVRDKNLKEVQSAIDSQTREDYKALTSDWGKRWDEIISQADMSGYNTEGLSEKVDELLREITDSATATEDDKLAYEKKRVDFWEKQQKEKIQELKDTANESDTDEYDSKWLLEQLRELEKNAKTDSLRAAVTAEIAELNKDIRNTWKDEAEKTVDEITKQADKAAEAQEKAAEKYSGQIDLFSQVTDSKGKKVNVFNDLGDISKKYSKYTEGLEKLKKTDIPSDLLSRIISIDDIDQKLEIINEILSLSDKGRDMWFSDYTKAMDAINGAAEAETADIKASADSGAQEALTTLKEGFQLLPEDAYKQGLASGDAFILGLNERLAESGTGYRIDLSADTGYTYANGGTAETSTASNEYINGNRQDAATALSAQGVNTNSRSGNSALYTAQGTVASDVLPSVLEGAVIISGDATYVVNVAGVEVIRKEIREFNKQNTLTGTNVTGL